MFKELHKVSGNMESGIVRIDGKVLDIGPSLKVRNHSPTGFSWGYGGSGPAQLALAIMLEHYGREVAERHYQDFKWNVISRLPRGDFKVEMDFAVCPPRII